MYYRLLITFLMALPGLSCEIANPPVQSTENQDIKPIEVIIPGAFRMDQYTSSLRDKNVGLVVNHTSLVGQVHLVDTLLGRGIQVKKIFAPEHGFRGTASAGKKLEDELDPDTGLPIISLYGANRKPTSAHLQDLDLVVFDIQDVGVRFYTYISTLSLVMEACAEADIPIMILDRPNPNGHYVDGPIREEGYKSFVAMHPVPVVYGMTIGELADMVNNEGWLGHGLMCDLTVIRCENYSHNLMYDLPVKPSPNLPNLRSILLYPSLCFFEGTVLSIGRGTQSQFQVIGHPLLDGGSYTFTPVDQEGAVNPKLKDQQCRGESLVDVDVEDLFAEKQINLSFLIKYYHQFPNKDSFFLPSMWIDKLAGTETLREDIIAGKTADEIRLSWQQDLNAFRDLRTKYLLYPDV